MLTFQLRSKEDAFTILEKVRLIQYAESLGGVETLITYPTTQTHADVPEEIRIKTESPMQHFVCLSESRISKICWKNWSVCLGSCEQIK